MFKVQLDVNLKEVGDFLKLKAEIKDKVINKGLDSSLSSSISELKRNLKYVINEQIREDSSKKSDTADNHKIDMPKSDADILRFVFGVDVEKINKNEDYTNSLQSNVFFINSGMVRLRIPEGVDGDMEQSYARAVNIFRNAIFVDTSFNKPRYYFLKNFDPKPYVKIVCSRDRGVTDKSRKTYDSYKNSPDRSKYQRYGLGRYSEWSLAKAGVQELKRSGSDITDIIEKIKESQYDEALNVLKANSATSSLVKVDQQITNLKDRQNLTPSIEAYNNILALINNLRILKEVKKDSVIYSLISDYEDINNTKFLDELDRNVNIWLITNQDMWFSELVTLASKVIEKFQEEGMLTIR